MRDVEALADLCLPSGILRISLRHDRGEPRSSLRIAGRKQRYVDSPRDETLRQERRELLPRAIVTRRDAPRDGRQNSDPKRGHWAKVEGGPTPRRGVLSATRSG